MKTASWCALLVSLSLPLSARAAQDKPAPDRPSPDKPAQERPADKPAQEKPVETGRRERMPVPLKVQILLTRHEGEKKVASLPYTLSVTAHEPPTRLRMGVEVPVTTGDPKAAIAQIQYRNVGVNVDCGADLLPDGRFKLMLVVEQSSVYVSGGEKRTGSWLSDAPLGPQPMFRTFNTQFRPVLRDGQSQEFTVAVDPVSGEVIKLEVTLNVIK